ncbi:membrane lipoprotein lipid attachment site-containing protein [Marinobacter salinisoli]|uniref:Membrane lipoprotein lipid attachment site-containing protein n=1 Tax=Marinobacter salinisoli TaxID=2769486 RepID=A0ABX7MQ41_9GAMM|nr:membrane lipoprotein lipid attachment site-containing protein [Marinobacter salinisoli]QSP94264.1 membrane lipoprotein lipid attachment site-containing protein [Marinobacter salinisoli]
MKKVMLVLVAVTALAGCKDRVIWNDNGKLDGATSENREIWNTNGKIQNNDRKIWVNSEGKEVVK